MLSHEHKQKVQRLLHEALEKRKSSMTSFFIDQYRITYLLLFLITFFGFFAIFTLPKEAEPEIQVPFALVSVVYPGANPTDVEELVIDKLEEKIENLDQLKKYESTSGLGFGSVFVEFEAEADVDSVMVDLKDVIDLARVELPEEVEDPVVSELNFNDIPIVTYSLSGPYPQTQLKRYAQMLQDEFESLSDVASAPITGAIEREFQVLVDQTKLISLGLSLSHIVSAVSMSNVSMPAGEIDVGDFTYAVRVQGKFEALDDLKNVIIAHKEGAAIRLADVGMVQDDFKKRNTISKVGGSSSMASDTVSLQVRKRSGGNILRIVKDTKEEIQLLRASGELPEDLQILKTNDNSVYIKDDVKRLGLSGIQTTILIILILLAVLGLRGALITGFSVPIAFLMAFIVIQFLGMTVNSMVLFALVLSLGLMVDNAIIVMEGVNEYMHVHDMSARDAAVLAIWNYKWPIIAGTMTTVSAFLPMLLVSGIMGEYMGILPKTISATLLSSLFVALIIIPSLSARFYRSNGVARSKHSFAKRIEEKMVLLKKDYVLLMKRILGSLTIQKRITRGAVLLLMFTIMLPVVGIMRVEMFPRVDLEFFMVQAELPIGSSLEKTAALVHEAEDIVRKIPELDNYVITIGESPSLFANDPGGGSGSHLGAITVNLVSKEKRNRTSYDIAKSIRSELAGITKGDVRVRELSAGPPTGAPFEARLFGTDQQELIVLGEKIKDIAENIDGLINVEDNIAPSSGEFVFSVDRARAQHHGLSVFDIARELRSAIYGAKASTVTLAGDQIDVTVKYRDHQLKDASDLQNIMLRSPSGSSVLASQVASLSLEPSLFSISHRDGKKIVKIAADTLPRADLRSIVQQFNEQISRIQLPSGFSIEVGGETEDITKSFQEIFLSMILAVFLILFILVLQFNSFKKPFVIIFTLPLAIVGAFFGLSLLGLAFSLPAFIGIVSLSGIVVNDAIVLMDRIDKNLKRNMAFDDGIIEAGVARMQPIFLTSITTIAGVFPLALSEELWQGLGFSIIFGLLFATVLTLIFVPVLYSRLCRKDFS